MNIRNMIASTAVAAALATASFGAQAQDKLTLVVGIWAVDPLTPWVEQFSESTGIEVEIQSFPFRDLLQTLEVRGSAQADDIDVVFVDAPLVPSYAVRGLIAPMAPYLEDVNLSDVWMDATVDYSDGLCNRVSPSATVAVLCVVVWGGSGWRDVFHVGADESAS